MFLDIRITNVFYNQAQAKNLNFNDYILHYQSNVLNYLLVWSL